MQMLSAPAVLVVLLSASFVSAHFSVTYPYWRGDSFKTQWTYPCGGVNQTDASEANRTAWPLDGGALVFEPSHSSAQTFININVTGQFVELVPNFNQTGNGTFCFPDIILPPGLNITEGSNATLQVIQLSHTGGALYNCADITFKKDAKAPDGICVNSTGVGAASFCGAGSPTATVTAVPGGAAAGRRSELALLGVVSMLAVAFLLW